MSTHLQPGGGSGSPPLGTSFSVTCNTGRLLTLDTVPLTLVPAPGATSAVYLLPWTVAIMDQTTPFAVDVTFEIGTSSTPDLWSFDLNVTQSYAISAAFPVPTGIGAFPGEALQLQLSKSLNAGPLAEVTIDAAGTGYAVGDILTVTSDLSGAQVLVGTIGGSGSVTGISLTAAGTDYRAVTGNATTPYGNVTAVSVHTGGSGYMVADQIAPSSAPDDVGAATFLVTSVSSGAVNGLTLISSGGCTTRTQQGTTATTGTGTGLLVDLTAGQGTGCTVTTTIIEAIGNGVLTLNGQYGLIPV